MNAANKIRIAVLGASGYTGAELLRLLAGHPAADLRVLTADSKAGKSLAEVHPHLGGLRLDGGESPVLSKIDEADFSDIDVVFCALPHGTTQEIVKKLASEHPHLKIVDLSADFRIDDPDVYAEWYGHEHYAPELQPEAVYGLTEFARDALKDARIAACPGCYPTTILMPVLPLVESGMIEADEIIIDAKSGVSGAGRALKENLLYGEVAEGIHAYGIGQHRHMPEMEQEIGKRAGRKITINFTPHLMPMNRGIFASIYVRLANGMTPGGLRDALVERFKGEPFVRVAPAGVSPATRHVRGSNHCLLGVFPDRIPGRAIVLSVTDNLVKGASGQAIQNMNLMTGLGETTGIDQQPMFP